MKYTSSLPDFSALPRILTFHAGDNIFAPCDHIFLPESTLPAVKIIRYAETNEEIRFENIADVVTRVMRRNHCDILRFAIHSTMCNPVDHLDKLFGEKKPLESAAYLNSLKDPLFFYLMRHYVPHYCVDDVEVVIETLVRASIQYPEKVFFCSGLVEVLTYTTWKKCTTDLHRWQTRNNQLYEHNSLFLKTALCQLYKNTRSINFSCEDESMESIDAIITNVVDSAAFDQLSETLSIKSVRAVKTVFPGLKHVLTRYSEFPLIQQWEWFLAATGLYDRASSRFPSQCLQDSNDTLIYFRSLVLREEGCSVAVAYDTVIFSEAQLCTLLHLQTSNTRDSKHSINRLQELFNILLWRCCDLLAAWTCSTLTSEQNIHVFPVAVHTFSAVWTDIWFKKQIFYNDALITNRKQSFTSTLDVPWFTDVVRHFVETCVNERVHAGNSGKVTSIVQVDNLLVCNLKEIIISDFACESLFFGLFYTVVSG